MKTLAVLPFAAVLAIAFIAVPSEAQNAYRQGLEDHLFRYWEVFIPDDHDITGAPMHGAVVAGASNTHMRDLLSDRHYVITVFCDQDCVEVGLTLHDAGGAVVSGDAETPNDAFGTAAAEFAFMPAANQSYEFEVTVGGCSTNPCNYAIGVFTDKRD